MKAQAIWQFVCKTTMLRCHECNAQSLVNSSVRSRFFRRWWRALSTCAQNSISCPRSADRSRLAFVIKMYHALLLCDWDVADQCRRCAGPGIPLRTRNDSVFRIAVCTFAVWDSLAFGAITPIGGLCFGGWIGRRRCISSYVYSQTATQSSATDHTESTAYQRERRYFRTRPQWTPPDPVWRLH